MHFPHADLLNDPVYLAWIAKRDDASKADPDWKDLFDWLGLHPRIFYQHDRVLFNKVSKCWYSENPISGKYVKDVEHFRPKGQANNLTKNQKTAFEKKLGFPLQEAKEKEGGYFWLIYEPKNYRLSHPQVNRSGKNDVFNILQGTRRLRKGTVPLPSEKKEKHYLLDPSNKEDATCLWVQPDGTIIPKYVEPDDFPLNPIVNWNSDEMKNIRAWVSIIVYDLNYHEFKRGRLGVYNHTLDGINDLIDAVKSKNTTWVDSITRQLMRLGSCANFFSLAARCAIAEKINSLGDSIVNNAVKTILRAVLQKFNTVESP